ncbi:MAG: fatty acid desaturase family protein [Mycobacterium sp.]
MQTIAAPVGRVDGDQRLLTEAVRPSPRELTNARRRLHFKAVVIAVLAIGSYWVLVLTQSSVVEKILATMVLIVALTATATGVFHDANHASFSTSRAVNRVAGFTGDLLGASSWIWRFKHNNLHHGNTNMVGIDADIDQAPFARLAPDQTWRPWHRYQHLYMWVLYGFLTLQWLLISDFVDLKNHGIGHQQFARQPKRRDISMIAVGKLMHIGWAVALPLVYHRWWIVLTFYLVVSWSVGLLLATMFQLAHCTEPAEFPHTDTPRRGNDFIAHQLRTTVDVNCRTRVGRQALHFLMGGLDFQVEHHLAPRLPHTVYPLVAERLHGVCDDLHLTVHSHATPWKAVKSHGRWLKKMGARP